MRNEVLLATTTKIDWLDLAQIRQLLGTLERYQRRSPAFKEVKVEYFEVGIIADVNSYSKPNLSLDNVLHYDKVQICLCEQVKQETHALKPQTDPRLQGFAWARYFEYQDAKGKTLPSYMGREIPLAEVCQMIKDLYRVAKMQAFS
jgi:hypothetical protein